jgi:hypothetical protein
VACALAAGSAWADPPTLRLDASPRQLIITQDSRVTLRLSAPVAPQDTRLACSAGTLHPLKRAAPGTLQALLTPPRSRAVLPLLCAAVVPASGAHATAVLELQRREVLPLRELPPLSRVELRVGNALYGPVRANAAGLAEVPVLLTPSTAQATLLVTPPGQAERREALALPVSSQPVVVLVPESPSVEANGQHSLRLWAFSVDERGAPYEGPLSTSQSGGRLELQRVAPGVHLGTFTPSPRSTPGEAVVAVRAGAGAQAAVRLALRAGVRPVLSVEALSRELQADGESGTDVTVWVRDEQGLGLPGQPVRLEAAHGQLSPLQDRGDGAYLARYRAPVSADRAEQLIARIDNAASASLTLSLVAPPRLVLELDAREAPADGKTRLSVRLTARGPEGALVPDGTELQLSTPLGTLPGSVRTREGRATAEWVAPVLAGEAVLSARLAEVAEQASVRFFPGAPGRVHVSTEERAVLCDGRDSVQVRLVVQDAHGNPLEQAPVSLRAAGTQAEHGRFERIASLGGGEFVTRYHAPALCEGGTATLVASAGEARGDTVLRLSSRTPRGLAIRMGAQSNLGRLFQPALELEGDVRPYALGARLAATASLQVAFGRLSLQGETGAREPFSVDARPVLGTLSLGGRWSPPLALPFSTYVGAGLDAHLARISYRVSLGQARQVQISPALGGHVRLGVALPLGPGQALLQGRYGLARLPADAPFRGAIGGLAVTVGYRFAL